MSHVLVTFVCLWFSYPFVVRDTRPLHCKLSLYPRLSVRGIFFVVVPSHPVLSSSCGADGETSNDIEALSKPVASFLATEPIGRFRPFARVYSRCMNTEKRAPCVACKSHRRKNASRSADGGSLLNRYKVISRQVPAQASFFCIVCPPFGIVVLRRCYQPAQHRGTTDCRCSFANKSLEESAGRYVAPVVVTLCGVEHKKIPVSADTFDLSIRWECTRFDPCCGELNSNILCSLGACCMLPSLSRFVKSSPSSSCCFAAVLYCRTIRFAARSAGVGHLGFSFRSAISLEFGIGNFERVDLPLKLGILVQHNDVNTQNVGVKQLILYLPCQHFCLQSVSGAMSCGQKNEQTSISKNWPLLSSFPSLWYSGSENSKYRTIEKKGVRVRIGFCFLSSLMKVVWHKRKCSYAPFLPFFPCVVWVGLHHDCRATMKRFVRRGGGGCTNVLRNSPK